MKHFAPQKNVGPPNFWTGYATDSLYMYVWRYKGVKQKWVRITLRLAYQGC